VARRDLPLAVIALRLQRPGNGPRRFTGAQCLDRTRRIRSRRRSSGRRARASPPAWHGGIAACARPPRRFERAGSSRAARRSCLRRSDDARELAARRRENIPITLRPPRRDLGATRIGSRPKPRESIGPALVGAPMGEPGGKRPLDPAAEPPADPGSSPRTSPSSSGSRSRAGGCAPGHYAGGLVDPERGERASARARGPALPPPRPRGAGADLFLPVAYSLGKSGCGRVRADFRHAPAPPPSS
jgi:hypothetical protein